MARMALVVEHTCDQAVGVGVRVFGSFVPFNVYV